MKFRDIAKMHAYNVGLKTPITERDMEHYLEHLGDSDSVTPGRLEKANEARLSLAESMANRWGLEKKFLKASHPGPAADNAD